MEIDEPERIADPSDQATRLELGHVVEQVGEIRRQVPDPTHRADECDDCGGDVEPPERRDMGYTTCITCAERKELKRGR